MEVLEDCTCYHPSPAMQDTEVLHKQILHLSPPSFACNSRCRDSALTTPPLLKCGLEGVFCPPRSKYIIYNVNIINPLYILPVKTGLKLVQRLELVQTSLVTTKNQSRLVHTSLVWFLRQSGI
jgi:hypothetical protein